MEYGGFKDKTQYILYDDIKNEINSYTDTQIQNLHKKGIFVRGIKLSDNSYNIVDNVYSRCSPIPGLIKLKNCGRPDWTFGLAHSDSLSNYIILEKPVNINKIKSGSVFLYKHLKLKFRGTRPIDKSTWDIYYNAEMFGQDKSQVLDNILPMLLGELTEIIPCLKYNVSITLRLDNVDNLDLSAIYQYTNNRVCSVDILSLNKANTIYVGKSNLQNSRFYHLISLSSNEKKVKKIVRYVDFSDCYNDYVTEEITHRGTNDIKYSCLNINKNINNVFVLCNERTPIFNKSLVNLNKLVYLGVVNKNNRYVECEQLLAKYVLINKDLPKNTNFIVLVK